MTDDGRCRLAFPGRRRHIRHAAGFAALAGLILSAGGPAAARNALESFYRDKTVTLVVAAGASGGYAAYARPVVEHIGRHLPGQPTIVIQFMQGGGGIKAANYIYNAAPKDGTYIGMPLSTLVLNQVLGHKGAKFEITKFNWLGIITTLSEIIVVSHDAPARTLADAKRNEIVIGATNKSSQTYLVPKLANALLGTQFRIITGYGDGEISLGMERGEFEGRMSAWESWMTTHPDWIAEKKAFVLLQTGVDRIRELPHVPRFMDLVKTAEDKALVGLLESGTAVGRSLFAPPGVARDRVQALRKAITAMLKDPEFLADAKARQLTIVPGSGERLQRLLTRVAKTPHPIVERFRRVVEYAN